MRDELHVYLLRLYRRLPTWARRRAVRTVSPSFTVGAMCVIERDDGRVLLVRHVYRNNWGVPGGLLKRGEDSADGARREVLEEVGLRIDLVGEAQVVVDAKPQRVDVIYRATPAAGADPDAAQPGSPEIERAEWFAPGDLPALQHETRAALDVLGRAEGRAT